MNVPFLIAKVYHFYNGMNALRRCSAFAGLIALSVTACFGQAAHSSSRAGTPRTPNIVILVADDLGWNDVGYHGSEIMTPHIDSLAARGIELDRFYAAPICTPTRAGLMTGRWPIRFGMQNNVVKKWDLYGMPAEEELIPEMLAKAGYAHRAAIGKWHLGHSIITFHPLNNGFTHFYGSYTGSVDYFTQLTLDEKDWHNDFDPSTDEGYTTDLIAADAVNYIHTYGGSGPLFLYIPFTAPHSPLEAPQEYLDLYPNLAGNRKILAAMITNLDDAVGNIAAALDEEGLADNTVFLFFSDNGGSIELGSDNTPLRDGKGSYYEGGLRTVAFIHWPSGLVGGRKLQSMISVIDVFPTLQHIVGLKGQEPNRLDGLDMLDVLRGEGAGPNRTFFSYMLTQAGSTLRERIAVINGAWKLTQWYTGEQELYNILDDPSETINAIGEFPAIAAKLESLMDAFRVLRPSQGLFPGVEPPGWVPPIDWKMAAEPFPIPVVDTTPDTSRASTPVLMWEPVDSAATYEVQVASSPEFLDIVLDDYDLVSPQDSLTGLTVKVEYFWRVRAFNTRKDRYSAWSDTGSLFLADSTLSAEESSPAAGTVIGRAQASVRVEPNFPNPFGVSTTFRFYLPRRSKVVLRIYDLLGADVATLLSERMSPGMHEFTWQPSNLPGGVYLFLLRADGQMRTGQIIHL